jgi:uncharacterized protein YcfJ
MLGASLTEQPRKSARPNLGDDAMRKAVRTNLIVASAILAVAAPSLANANCHDRKVGGTLIGAAAGGLIGNSVAHGGGKLGGTLIGAGVGGVAGHEIAASGCRDAHRYYHHRRHHHDDDR